MTLILGALIAIAAFVLGLRVGVTFGHWGERRKQLREGKARAPALPQKRAH